MRVGEIFVGREERNKDEWKEGEEGAGKYDREGKENLVI